MSDGEVMRPEHGKPEHPKPEPPAVPRDGHLLWARGTAVVVMAFYLGLVLFMLVKRTDPGWDHMDDLLNGLQAIVFTAAGLLLGTQIQRSAVERADEDAKQARAEATRQRHQAAGGRAMAEVARAANNEQATAESTRRDGSGSSARQGGRKATAPADVHGALLALANQYFPRNDEE